MTGGLPLAPPSHEIAPPSRWADALLAAQLFAVDPVGLGGVGVLGGPGPARDLWFERLKEMLARDAPVRRLPPGIGDDRLIGAIDLTATLACGRPVMQKGVLAEADGGIVVIPMAERLSPGVAGRIAGVLDRREVVVEREGMARRLAARIGVVAFDEGLSADERLPRALQERFAFHIDLREVGMGGIGPRAIDAAAVAGARACLASVAGASPEIVTALVATAAAAGIRSVVAPLLALRAARAAAALAGRHGITDEDALLAARLVLAPRAGPAADADSPAPSDGDESTGQDAAEGQDNPLASPEEAVDDGSERHPPAEPPSLDDIMLAAVQAALPDGLLATMRAGGPMSASRRSGAGTQQASLLRGRPAGVRMGALRPGARLALVETLRAAVPWQALRRAEAPDRLAPRRLEIRREDFRIKKFVQRRESTIIFCVDASGSTAFHRLAETKGAVELLLADAYVSRTHVALVVFRGRGADLLLPPTRSLSRAKALLGGLPGGGGTPLAAGIAAAALTAVSERAKGREPMAIILTDGRANIAGDGQASRPRAMAEALGAARQLATLRIAAVFVDTSPRPHGDAARLADAMQARYVALPYVEARAVRDVALAAGPASLGNHRR